MKDGVLSRCGTSGAAGCRQTVRGAAALALVWYLHVHPQVMAFDPAGHNAICDAALAGHGFSAESVEAIKEADVGVDESDGAGALPGLVNDNYASKHHFDRNPGMTDADAFQLGASWLRVLRQDITNAILRCTQIGVDAALQGIGRALHALQDFYAHSNYIELSDSDQDLVDAAFADPGAPLPAGLKLTGFDPDPSAWTYYGDVYDAYNPPGDPYPHGLFSGNHKDKPDTHGDGGNPVTRGETTKTGYEWATEEAARHTSEFIDSIYNSEGIAAKWAGKFGTNLIASYVVPSNYIGGVRQSVGPGGGVVKDDNGTAANIPPGCVPAQTFMRILTPRMSDVPADLCSSIADGRIVALREFCLSSGNLSAAASVTLDYSAENIATLCETSLGVYAWNEYATPCGPSWEKVPSSVNTSARKVTFQANHFSTYALYGALLDADGDGMQDSWENTHFGGTNVSNGALDTDNDGVSDAAEFMCDTIPTNRNSFLAISSIKFEGSGVCIVWHGGVAVTQCVERTTNLVTGPWMPVFTNTPPAATSTNWTDSWGKSYPDVFYRMSVPGVR